MVEEEKKYGQKGKQQVNNPAMSTAQTELVAGLEPHKLITP